jgi:hypothetical protein
MATIGARHVRKVSAERVRSCRQAAIEEYCMKYQHNAILRAFRIYLQSGPINQWENILLRRGRLFETRSHNWVTIPASTRQLIAPFGVVSHISSGMNVLSNTAEDFKYTLGCLFFPLLGRLKRNKSLYST